MRTDGVYRKIKCDGNVPGGLAFHTKVIDCNFILRFHIIIISFPVIEGEQPKGYSPGCGIMP